MPISIREATLGLTAVALLVVGVDYASYAATGDSLIVGKLNQASTTTTLANDQPGPALRLKSKGKDRPSLAVTSPARVKNLNADLLDGKQANTLATRAVTYRGGSPEQSYPGQAMWSVPVKPGIYHASFRVLLVAQQTTPGEIDLGVCGLLDLATMPPAPGSEIPHIYAAQTGSYGEDLPVLALSGAETVRITPQAKPGLLCQAATPFVLGNRVVTSWTPINHRSGQQMAQYTPPRPVRGLIPSRPAGRG